MPPSSLLYGKGAAGMGLNQAPAGKYTVIVVEAKVIHLDHKQAKVAVLEMAVTSGEHAYKRCTKNLYCKLDELAMAKMRFTRMGGVLTDWDTFSDDAQQLVGAQLVVDVYFDDNDNECVKIYKYVGRGNPKKYC